MDVLLAHDVLHVPDPREVELELPIELCLRLRQLVACHQLEKVPAPPCDVISFWAQGFYIKCCCLYLFGARMAKRLGS